MASTQRRTLTGLIDQACAEPYRFEFFQLVRLLRLHYSRAGRIDPETRPHDDPLRFRSQLSLNFPCSEVSELFFEHPHKVSSDGKRLTEVQVTFMGLVGPSGELPRPYTELLLDRHIQHRDDAAHAFFDLFSHRMTSLFYEAWQKYRFHIEHERKGSSRFGGRVLDLLGLDLQARSKLFDRPDAALRPELLSYFAGLFIQKPRNAVNLQSLLGFTFDLPFCVRPFAGRWLQLGCDQRSRLGRTNSALGQSAVVGARIWDYQSCIRIEIGPMELADYERFQPGTPDYQLLIRTLRFYLGLELDCQIAPLLKRDALPLARLGRAGNVVLGRKGWLKHRARRSKPDRCALFNLPFDGVCP